MSNGDITVLKINKNDSQLITTLKGHSGSVGKLQCFAIITSGSEHFHFISDLMAWL